MNSPDNPQPQPRTTRADERQALIDATVRLALRDGLGAVNFRAVAAEAGVANDVVGRYFATRAALVHEAVTDFTESFKAEHARLIRAPDERPGAVAADLCEYVDCSPALHLLGYETMIESLRIGDLLSDERQVYETLYADAARELSRAGLERTPALARLLVAALDGIVIQQLVTGRRDLAEETLAELHALIRSAAGREAHSQRR